MTSDKEKETLQRLILLTEAGVITWKAFKQGDSRVYKAVFNNQFNMVLLCATTQRPATFCLADGEGAIMYSFNDCTDEAQQLQTTIEDGVLSQVDLFCKEILATGISGPAGL